MCVSKSADVCVCELTFTSLYYPLRSCMDVGSRNWSHQSRRYWLLTTQTGTLCPHSLLPHILPTSSLFIHRLICSFSVSLSLYPLSLFIHCFLSIHPPVPPSLPFSSPRQMVSVSLGWLQNQRCNSPPPPPPPSLLLCLSLSPV